MQLLVLKLSDEINVAASLYMPTPEQLMRFQYAFAIKLENFPCKTDIQVFAFDTCKFIEKNLYHISKQKPKGNSLARLSLKDINGDALHTTGHLDQSSTLRLTGTAAALSHWHHCHHCPTQCQLVAAAEAL